MNLTHTMHISLIALGVSIALVARAGAQTTPGLLVTQPELDIWKQRAISGPYKSQGDVSPYSPGDWDAIQANANNLVTGSGGNDWWTGCTTPGYTCPMQNGEPDTPRTRFNATRDAAFSWLVSGNTTHRDKAKTQLLLLSAECGLDFTNASCWPQSPYPLNDGDPVFGTQQLLLRLLFGYSYVRGTFTSGEQAKLDAWFLNMGDYWEKTQQARWAGTGYWADSTRETLTDFSLSGGGQSSAGSASGGPLYCNGPYETGISGIWNNRTAEFPALFGLIGAYFDSINSTSTTQHLIKKAKRWVMEWLLYAVWPNGEITEWARSAQQEAGYLGWAYSQQNLGYMLIIADALARHGDAELYQMQTTSTGISTRAGSTGYTGALNWGAGKSLQFVASQQTKYTTNELRRTSLNCTNPSYPTDYQRDELTGVRDTFVAESNQYWRDTCHADTTCLQTRYLRTAPGAIPYPASPTSGGTNPWGGTGGIFPGILFMYGQMEGQVQPYPGSDVPSAPKNLRIISIP